VHSENWHKMMNHQKPPNFLTLDSLGPNIQIPFRYSSKAKNISIRINHDGPELVLPHSKLWHTKSLDSGHRFLLAKESWIRQKLQNRTEHIIPDKNAIPIFGKIHSIEYIDAYHYKAAIKEDIIQISSSVPKRRDNLIKFLKEMLLEDITDVAEFLSKKHNLHFSKIRITNNKSKWGSCSSQKVISFNWRLIFAPKEIVDYLVVHEMCHIAEMNHSKNFWNLVEKVLPEYKSAKSWLKANGSRLHQYL